MGNMSKLLNPENSYKPLEGRGCYGAYRGLMYNKDFGTKRAVFEVNSQDPRNKPILELFAVIRKHNGHSSTKIWRGFSSDVDYNQNSSFENLRIWAPMTSALRSVCENKPLELHISRVRAFDFQRSTKRHYQVGINIHIRHDSSKRLEEHCRALVSQDFRGRYVGLVRGMNGILRPIYEIDPEDPFNKTVCEKFDDIRESWLMDGLKVMKSFTSAKDLYAKKNWKLRIWAQNKQSDAKKGQERIFTIRDVGQEDRFYGRYASRMFFNVSG